MMEIVDSTMLNILNYGDSIVTVASHIYPEGYKFEASIDEQPYSITLSYAEVRVINSQTNVFRDGFLFFEEDIQEAVYTKLGIRNWKDILTNEDIKNIILNPTKDGLTKIIKINNISYFERVRGILIMHQNTNVYDISKRVIDVITIRYEELYNNKINSQIQITSYVNEKENKVDANEIEKIKEEMKLELEQQKQLMKEVMLEELRKQIRAELESEYKNNELKSSDANVDKPDVTEKKSAGRPKSK